MPDVSIVRVRTPYRPDDAVRENRQSALRLVHQLLALDGVTNRHLMEQLKIGLWKWTEAEGVGPHPKFNTRFVSAGVLAQQSPARINHEHVWTMKNHVEKLTQRSWTLVELENYLKTYGVACIVTVAEHAQLSGSRLDGWRRYQEAAIGVFDRTTQEWLDLGGPPGEIEATSRPSSPGRPAAGEIDPPPFAAKADVLDLIAGKAQPDVAVLLARLHRTVGFASAAAAPSFKRSGEVSAYFRIHDTLIEEPTPAVAYAHWTGKLDVALLRADLPEHLVSDHRVSDLGHSRYGLTVRMRNDETLALAEELLLLSLEKLRSSAVPD